MLAELQIYHNRKHPANSSLKDIKTTHLFNKLLSLILFLERYFNNGDIEL